MLDDAQYRVPYQCSLRCAHQTNHCHRVSKYFWFHKTVQQNKQTNMHRARERSARTLSNVIRFAAQRRLCENGRERAKNTNDVTQSNVTCNLTDS